MKKGFTLVELLVVIGIMGLLGTVSVGGYRAMQRGMAERGVMEGVNSFVRAAYQRAQIDRQPTAIYFWNETLRRADDYNSELVVGRAVAIRRSGRLSRVDGGKLFDEFADLDLSYSTDDNAVGSGNASATGGASGEGSGEDDENTMYLYPIDKLSDVQSSADLKRSVVYQKVYHDEATPIYFSGNDGGALSDNQDNGKITTYAFRLAPADGGKVQWKQVMAYGLEFAQMELPHGFIFGSSYSTDVGVPVKVQGTLVFNVGFNSGNGVSEGVVGRNSITVSVLRPGKTGELSAQSLGQSQDPTEEMR